MNNLQGIEFRTHIYLWCFCVVGWW